MIPFFSFASYSPGLHSPNAFCTTLRGFPRSVRIQASPFISEGCQNKSPQRRWLLATTIYSSSFGGRKSIVKLLAGPQSLCRRLGRTFLTPSTFWWLGASLGDSQLGSALLQSWPQLLRGLLLGVQISVSLLKTPVTGFGVDPKSKITPS